MNSKLKSKFSILLLVFFPWCRGIGLPAPLPQNLQPPDRTSLPLERVFAEDQDSFVSEEDFSREGRGYETDLLLPLEEEEGYWAGNENLRSQPMPKGEEGGGVPEELRSGINCQGGNDQVSHIDCLTLLALQATRRRRNGSDELSSRTDDANVMPGVKDVQERGFKWGFGSKKSRKGKKKRPGTVIRRAKSGRKGIGKETRL
ncbi:uncharacterized protein [Macrobrachium rosenbergii]|uniref:uncharacterized protein n=1 Tax=Macrobrachium rosenbergii TaxID=79674 RepID=UPI0034D732EC